MSTTNAKNKQTYNVSDVKVGDIVKFKGTRNKGYRKVIQIEKDLNMLTWVKEVSHFFSKVLNQKMSGFSEQPYTSTNSVDKLSHVFRDGTWFKVIKD